MPLLTGLTNDGLEGTPTDNWSVIQGAIDGASEQGEFEFPPGDYFVAQPVKIYGYCKLWSRFAPMTRLVTDSATTPCVLLCGAGSAFGDGNTFRYGGVESLTLANLDPAGPVIKTRNDLHFFWGALRDLIVGSGGIDLTTMQSVTEQPTSTSGFVIDRILMDKDFPVTNSIVRVWGNGIGTVRNVRINGGVHANWVNGRPLVDLEIGQGGIEDYHCEPTFASGQDGYGLHIKGGPGSVGITWRGIHFEPHGADEHDRRVTDKINCIIDGATVFADHMMFAGLWGRLKLDGGARVFFDSFNIAGDVSMLRDVVLFGDTLSRFTANEVISRYDCGYLRHPQVHVGHNTYDSSGTPRTISATLPPRTKGGNRVKASPNWTGLTGVGGAVIDDSSAIGMELTVTTSDTPANSYVQVTIPIDGVVDFFEFEVTEPTNPPKVWQCYATDQSASELKTRLSGNAGLTRVWRPGSSLTSVILRVYQTEPGTFTVKNVATYREDKS